MNEQDANNLFAVLLMANAVIESAKKPKGQYVLVSKKKLALLREALERSKMTKRA